MLLPRSSALRVASVARLARPARSCRITELQPWQRVLQLSARRAYASGPGPAGQTKTSDLPWAVGAVLTTGVGLYVVTKQDLGHGGGHGDHDEHAEHHDEHKEEAPDGDEKSEPSSYEKNETANKEQADDEKKTDPAHFDKPDTDKEAKKGLNTMSGKQQGLSNDDTGHTHPPETEAEKSKKGEGVAESAKLKGTVAPDRPPAENKEERGKTSQDYNK